VQTPLRLTFHPSAKKHAAAMALPKIQRSGNRDRSSVKPTERQLPDAPRMMQAVTAGHGNFLSLRLSGFVPKSVTSAICSYDQKWCRTLRPISASNPSLRLLDYFLAQLE
jgi:hypothetical protein